ncbi:hypothetical protein IQ22_04683 [Pseudomonas duriflava]|uniref:Uncharacterized protein n=1 Tax=Pseudomonas duriflava TaxID=459528 RepID=A0A562PKT5_9PSED|nr:hypothetical protein [Pseudomonas duriflava]TWI45044.1 hypothetical protein IQ22_04683 [Pseudomonas duriflava]
MNGDTVVTRAKQWWRRVEIWFIGAILVLSGMIIGYHIAMYGANQRMNTELTTIRDAYNQALVNLARTTGQAATTAANAAQTSSQAANQAAEKATQALEQVQQTNEPK